MTQYCGSVRAGRSAASSRRSHPRGGDTKRIAIQMPIALPLLGIAAAAMPTAQNEPPVAPSPEMKKLVGAPTRCESGMEWGVRSGYGAAVGVHQLRRVARR